MTSTRCSARPLLEARGAPLLKARQKHVLVAIQHGCGISSPAAGNGWRVRIASVLHVWRAAADAR